jgi:hypothetical protein
MLVFCKEALLNNHEEVKSSGNNFTEVLVAFVIGPLLYPRLM